VQQGGELRIGSVVVREKGHDAAFAGVVLGDAQVIPARIVVERRGRHALEVDQSQTKETSGQHHGFERAHRDVRPARKPSPGGVEAALASGGHVTKHRRRTERDHASRKKNGQGGHEPGQGAGDDHRDDERDHADRHAGDHLLEEREMALAEDARDHQISGGDASGVEQSRRAPEHEQPPEEPVPDRIDAVDRDETDHRGGGAKQSDENPPRGPSSERIPPQGNEAMGER